MSGVAFSHHTCEVKKKTESKTPKAYPVTLPENSIDLKKKEQMLNTAAAHGAQNTKHSPQHEADTPQYQQAEEFTVVVHFLETQCNSQQKPTERVSRANANLPLFFSPSKTFARVFSI